MTGAETSPPQRVPRPSPLLMELYRRLLATCPTQFRQEFEDEILEFAGARLAREGQHRLSRVGCWLHLFSDLILTSVLARCQDQSSIEAQKERPMPNLLQDLKYSFRSLTASPGFTILALLLIGLGVGVNTAMFSIVDGLLFRPHPWRDPDRVVRIYQDSDSGSPNSCSYPAFLDMAAQRELFSNISAMIQGRSASQRSESGLTREVRISFVTSEYFEVTGLSPTLGLDFAPEHDVVGGVPAAIVSYRTWQRDFSGDRSILGSQVMLNGAPVALLGVGPEGYQGATPGADVDYWVSISAAGPVGGPYYVSTMQTRSDHWFQVMARLQPGVSPGQVQAAMDLLADRLAADFPQQNQGRRISVFEASDVRIHPSADSNLKAGAVILMGIVGLVLLVAAANLGNLLVARSMTRKRELAVRLAMGATRTRLVQLILSEAFLLAASGAVLALLLSLGLARILAAVSPSLPIPLALEIQIDQRVLLFSLAVAILTTLAFGIVPALRATRPDLLPSLQDGAISGGRRRTVWRPDWLTLRNGLVVGQISASLVLVLTAGLFVRSLLNSQQAELGFEPDRLAMIEVDARQAGYEGEALSQFFRTYQERIAALPGVQQVVLATSLPVTASRSSTTLLVRRDEEAGEVQKAEVPITLVDPDYFSALGVRMLYGRSFLPEEWMNYSPVAIVNRAFAEKLLGDVNAVGRRYRHESQSDTWVQIVGVVENSKVYSLQEEPTPLLYRVLPRGMAMPRLLLVARTPGDPASLLGPMKSELRDLNQRAAIYQLQTVSSHVEGSLALPRWGAQFLVGLGLLGLMMAAVGLYSVVNYLASQRKTEMGIRMALGSTQRGVVILFLRRMMLVAGVGILLGLGATILLQPVLQGFLYEVPVLDPLTVGSVVFLLLAVTAFAIYLPTRRASRIDPLTSIRRI